MRRAVFPASLATWFLPLALLPHLAGAQADAPTAPSTRRVEEIVVTARKRAELLEDTPVAVTALGAQTLRDSGVGRLDDVSDLVPNLTFLGGRNGQNATVFVRGIGQVNSPIITFDPGVGIYVDGVYLARAQGALLDVVDVEQVEVLRGPQGTLFGKNTVGGAILVTTAKPTAEPHASVRVRAGNYDLVETRATLNLPIGFGPLEDQLFARLSFGSTNMSGYTYNELRDEHWSDRNSLSFIGTLRYQPSDSLTVDLTGNWSRAHSRTNGGQCVWIQQTDTLEAFWPGRFQFEEECRQSRPFRFRSNVASLNDVESYGTWATIAWDAGDVGPLTDFSLRSITSWREQVPRLREDFDMTGNAVGQASQVGGGPFDGSPGEARQISQEIHVTGRALDDRLSFLAGYYVFWEDAFEHQGVRAFPGPLTGGPSPLGELTTATTERMTEVSNWSWAAFTQLTLDVTDWLSMTAGVRYTEEKKGLAMDLSRPPLPPEAPTQDPLTLVDVTESDIFSAWTPMASVSVRAPDHLLEQIGLDHLMTYFTYSRGFKSGGFNGMTRDDGTRRLSSFRPEFLDSYELGVKTILWGERLVLNLALFTGDYSDQQIQAVVLGEPLIENGPPVVTLEVRNAAESTSRGVELEGILMPVDGLTVTGHVGYLDATFDEFLAPSAIDGGGIVDRAGQRFPFVPEFQSRLAAQYSLPLDLGPITGTLTPRLEWSYKTRVRYAGAELPEATQGAYHLLSARVTWSFMDDRAQIAVWGQNLLDETYFEQVTGSAQSFGQIARFYQPPATFGVELSYRL